MKRPPPAVRIAIVVAAVACLGLAMCARSRPPKTPPPTQQVQQPAGTEAGGGSGTPQQVDPKPSSRHFPATKAPGPMY